MGSKSMMLTDVWQTVCQCGKEKNLLGTWIIPGQMIWKGIHYYLGQNRQQVKAQ